MFVIPTSRPGWVNWGGTAIDSKFELVLNNSLCFVLLEFEMNSRYFLSALAGIFLAVAFVAVVTTVRHLSRHQTVAMSRR